MRNSKLIEILKTFSKDEMKEFDKFISSPYFGCRKFIMDFLKLLRKYHPDFKEENIKKEILFAEMYPGKKYNDGLLRRMSSEIIKYALDYLAFKKFNEINAFKNHCLQLELRNRNLNHFFELKSGKVISEYNDTKKRDLYTLLDKSLTDIEIYNYKNLNNKPDTFIQLEESLESALLLGFYFIVNTMDKILLINYDLTKSITRDSANSSMIEDFLKMFAGPDDIKHILFRAFYFAFRIIKDKSDEASYLELKKLLTEKKEFFTDSQRRTFISYIFYFYSYHNSRNSDKYYEDEYEMYNLLLRENLFLNFTPYMTIFFCRNYIIACRRTGKANGILNFIKNYSGYFIPQYSQDIINYANSNVMLSKKEFGKSLKYSSEIMFDVPLFRCDIKIIRIKCYYELGYDESLYSEIDSLKHLLTKLNSKDPKYANIGYTAKTCLIFLSYLPSLMKIKSGFSKSNKKILLQEIRNEVFLAEKNWLIEKLNELS
jgi:hypothetical protein